MKQTIQAVYITVYIHVLKKMKKKLSLRYRVSHMEMDCKEQEGSKDDRTLEQELTVDLFKG
jgi:hypothetical protein